LLKHVFLGFLVVFVGKHKIRRLKSSDLAIKLFISAYKLYA